MAKLALTNLANLQNETTAVNAINANNAATIAAVEKTLSRDGTTPNQMSSRLDMNSNRILNLPTAISTSEPITLAQMNSILASGQVPNGLVTAGVPVSVAMQPVVNASTIAVAQGLLGISGATSSVITPEQYGATGNGVTDDTVAINLAIAAANISGGTLAFGPHTYIYSTLNTINATVDIAGSGWQATILKTNVATGDTLTHNGKGAIRDIGFDSSVVRTSGATIKITGNGVSTNNIWVKRGYIGLYNTGRINWLSHSNIELMTSRTVAPGSGGVINDGGILNCVGVSVAGSTLTPADMPEFCYKGMGNAGGCELDMVNCYGFLANKGIWMTTTASGGVNGYMITNCWFDSMLEHGALIDSTAGSSNSPGWITGSWFAPGYGSTAVIAGIEFKGPNTGDVLVTGNRVLSYNNLSGSGILIRDTGGFQRAIYCSNNKVGGTGTGFVVGVSVENNTHTWSVEGGAVVGNTTGIQIGTGNDIYTIVGVDVSGNGTAISNFSPAATSKKIGLNPTFDIISANTKVGVASITYDSEGRITAIS